MNLLDLSNMKNLKDIYKDGNVRKTIDLRGCFNLESFWHTNNGEIVCISSGMTKYRQNILVVKILYNIQEMLSLT